MHVIGEGSAHLFVVYSLHLAAKASEECSWPYESAKHLDRASVEAFAAKNQEKCTYAFSKTATELKITITINDLTELCKFEAYDSVHQGGVWHGNNYCSVVAPAILTFREKFQTKKAPFQTKSALHGT